MSTINNFDKSSTGINIEFTGSLDSDRGQWMFDDNFETLTGASYGESTLLYFIDYGNVSNSEDITFNVKGKKADLIDFLLDYGDGSTVSEYRVKTKSELIEEVEDLLCDEMNVTGYMNENEELLKYELEIIPSKELVKIVSRGYSQGDYAEVLYCPKDLKEVWGNGSSEVEMGKLFDNLLWDTPVYAVLTIDGEEFNYGDSGLKEYEFEREEFLKQVSNKTNVHFETLDELVLTELKYV